MSKLCAEAKTFFNEHGIDCIKEISQERFDQLCRGSLFREGPHREQFGDGRYEPYNPDRQAFGILAKGYGVWCVIRVKP